MLVRDSRKKTVFIKWRRYTIEVWKSGAWNFFSFWKFNLWVTEIDTWNCLVVHKFPFRKKDRGSFFVLKIAFSPHFRKKWIFLSAHLFATMSAAEIVFMLLCGTLAWKHITYCCTFFPGEKSYRSATSTTWKLDLARFPIFPTVPKSSLGTTDSDPGKRGRKRREKERVR